MNNGRQALESEALGKGIPSELMSDFFEDIDSNPRYANWAASPTLTNVQEYMREQDSSYNSQVRWDAQCRKLGR